jgi:hypothetical protein
VALIHHLVDDGRVYLTLTCVDRRFVIRVAVGGWATTREGVTLLPDRVAEAH